MRKSMVRNLGQLPTRESPPATFMGYTLEDPAKLPRNSNLERS
jgi:hypothetical protein